jgi:hypothetical protein
MTIEIDHDGTVAADSDSPFPPWLSQTGGDPEGADRRRLRLPVGLIRQRPYGRRVVLYRKDERAWYSLTGTPWCRWDRSGHEDPKWGSGKDSRAIADRYPPDFR